MTSIEIVLPDGRIIWWEQPIHPETMDLTIELLTDQFGEPAVNEPTKTTSRHAA